MILLNLQDVLERIEGETSTFFQPKSAISWPCFESLCYLSTHIIFILSSWGMSAPRQRPVVEAISGHIKSSMRVAIRMNHIELVGEFVDVSLLSLSFLFTPLSHFACQCLHICDVGEEEEAVLGETFLEGVHKFKQNNFYSR